MKFTPNATATREFTITPHLIVGSLNPAQPARIQQGTRLKVERVTPDHKNGSLRTFTVRAVSSHEWGTPGLVFNADTVIKMDAPDFVNNKANQTR